MMRDAAAGAFEAVVFYDLDRFGRNAQQTMVALNTLADLGVTIWDYSTGQRRRPRLVRGRDDDVHEGRASRSSIATRCASTRATRCARRPSRAT